MESEQLRELLSVAAPLGFGGPRAVECERFGMIKNGPSLRVRHRFIVTSPLPPTSPPPQKKILLSPLSRQLPYYSLLFNLCSSGRGEAI